MKIFAKILLMVIAGLVLQVHAATAAGHSDDALLQEKSRLTSYLKKSIKYCVDNMAIDAATGEALFRSMEEAEGILQAESSEEAASQPRDRQRDLQLLETVLQRTCVDFLRALAGYLKPINDYGWTSRGLKAFLEVVYNEIPGLEMKSLHADELAGLYRRFSNPKGEFGNVFDHPYEHAKARLITGIQEIDLKRLEKFGTKDQLYTDLMALLEQVRRASTKDELLHLVDLYTTSFLPRVMIKMAQPAPPTPSIFSQVVELFSAKTEK